MDVKKMSAFYCQPCCIVLCSHALPGHQEILCYQVTCAHSTAPATAFWGVNLGEFCHSWHLFDAFCTCPDMFHSWQGGLKVYFMSSLGLFSITSFLHYYFSIELEGCLALFFHSFMCIIRFPVFFSPQSFKDSRFG